MFILYVILAHCIKNGFWEWDIYRLYTTLIIDCCLFFLSLFIHLSLNHHWGLGVWGFGELGLAPHHHRNATKLPYRAVAFRISRSPPTPPSHCIAILRL